MFTGIVQAVARVKAIRDHPGLRNLTLEFPAGLIHDLRLGASVAVDGVCLTVSELQGPDAARFDVMSQSLALTTLGVVQEGQHVNVERAARDGAEIGGHPLSGHIDFAAIISDIDRPQNNCRLRMSVPSPWMRYLFARGYVAVNGASLTLAQIQREADGSGWFEVWLIPETLRMTTFSAKAIGALVNVEVDRQTQILVDTIRDAVAERLEPLLQERGVALNRNAASMSSAALQKLSRAVLSTRGRKEMAKRKQGTTKGRLQPHANDGLGPAVSRPKKKAKRKAPGKKK
jgi:riboflavin synthase